MTPDVPLADQKPPTRITRGISIAFLIVGGLPMIPYPIIAMASLMSLAGHTTGDEPVLLMMVVRCFLWGSLAYAPVYVGCVALACRALKAKRAALGFSSVPLLYLLVLASLMMAWMTLANDYKSRRPISGAKTSAPVATGVRSGDLLGKWRLVRVGGEPPSALNVKSLQIEIAADGKWASSIEMQGTWEGMSMKGGGNWSLADGIVSYSSGENTGKSRARLESGRLVLDPDFSLRKGGTEEVVGEYER